MKCFLVLLVLLRSNIGKQKIGSYTDLSKPACFTVSFVEFTMAGFLLEDFFLSHLSCLGAGFHTDTLQPLT